MSPTVEISRDPARLDVGLIYDFLSHSYWAAGRTLEMVQRSLQNSICFGAYSDGKQVGFARVVTDHATFAYLADVFVVPANRGQGISKMLVASVLGAPELKGVNVWLRTRDAHGLYHQFGFKPAPSPENILIVANHA